MRSGSIPYSLRVRVTSVLPLCSHVFVRATELLTESIPYSSTDVPTRRHYRSYAIDSAAFITIAPTAAVDPDHQR